MDVVINFMGKILLQYIHISSKEKINTKMWKKYIFALK